MRFSWLGSVYEKESSANLWASLNSLIPTRDYSSEVVLVEDGPIGNDLSNVISEFRSTLNIQSIKLPRENGKAIALRSGLVACTEEIVLRLDIDDISLPERVEKELGCFEKDPELGVVGAAIEEFRDDSERTYIRSVPSSHEAINRGILFRNPFNHMTVAFRRKQILAAGSYEDVPLFEDWFLWMKLRGRVKWMNLEQVLVRARTSSDFYRRRTGLRYLVEEWRFRNRVLGLGNLQPNEAQIFTCAIACRLLWRVVPPALLRVAYNTALRKRKGVSDVRERTAK